MTKRRDRSNESNFDRGWGSDRPMTVFTRRDGILMEGISLPRGVRPPSEGEGFEGAPDRYRPGYTWWTRIVPILVAIGIFLCIFPQPLIRLFTKMVA